MRDKIQSEAVSLASQYPNIVYEIATGVGKSYIAIQVIELLGGNWDIVIAERAHKLNWIEEFKKHGKEYLLSKVTFYCYASLHKHIGNENYIFDEVHHLFSIKRLQLLAKIRPNLKHFLGLSATLSKKHKEWLTYILPNVYYHKVSLSTAIALDILPEPKVYFYGISLDNTNRFVKYHFTKDKFIMVTEQEWYNKTSDRIQSLKERFFQTRQDNDKVRWLSLASKRKNFLSDIKTKYARILLHKLQNKRLIVFCGSIAQAESLGSKLALHSNLSAKQQENILSSYITGETNKIFVKGMLKEGINIPGIEAGMVIQLDNNTLMYTQTLGRSLRSSTPEQYVLYVKNSQDEVYVNTALEGFNMDYVEFKEITL